MGKQEQPARSKRRLDRKATRSTRINTRSYSISAVTKDGSIPTTKVSASKFTTCMLFVDSFLTPIDVYQLASAFDNDACRMFHSILCRRLPRRPHFQVPSGALETFRLDPKSWSVASPYGIHEPNQVDGFIEVMRLQQRTLPCIRRSSDGKDWEFTKQWNVEWLTPHAIPHTARSVKFSGHLDLKLKPHMLPPDMDILTFSGGYISVAPQSICNCKVVNFGFAWVDLQPGSITNGTECIKFARNTGVLLMPGVLPSTLSKLDLNCCPTDIRCGVLPEGLQELSIAHPFEDVFEARPVVEFGAFPSTLKTLNIQGYSLLPRHRQTGIDRVWARRDMDVESPFPTGLRTLVLYSLDRALVRGWLPPQLESLTFIEPLHQVLTLDVIPPSVQRIHLGPCMESELMHATAELIHAFNVAGEIRSFGRVAYHLTR